MANIIFSGGQKVKLKLFLLICLLISLTGVSFATSLKLEARITHSELKQMLGDKFFTMDECIMAKNNGQVFLLARDNKTRNLEWFLIDPFTKKILGTGICPFKAYTRMGISPAANSALVYGRYPTSLWHLDVAGKTWKNLYKNPGKGQSGLAILSLSGISFTETFRAFSILDMWDKEHFVDGTYITAFLPNNQQMEKVVKLEDMAEKAIKKVFKEIPKELVFKAEHFVFGDNKNILFVLKSRSRTNKSYYREYLCLYLPSGEVNILTHLDGRLYPLDFDLNNSRILYTATTRDGGSSITLLSGRTKVPVWKGKGLAGKIMNNGLVGAATIEGKTLNILLGTAGQSLTKAVTLTQPYLIGFMDNGSGVVLINTSEILAYRIVKQ
jgi:hypothetical protein